MANDPDRTDKARQTPPSKNPEEQHENTKEKLDARLDHGIKESFPGSDPVSVKVSKYAPGDDGRPDDQDTAADQDRANGVYGRAREAAAALSEKAGEAMADLSQSGRDFVPRVAREFGRGRGLVTQKVSDYPVPALILAGVIGLGVGLIAYEALSSTKPRRTR
jgi:hypothetical protein